MGSEQRGKGYPVGIVGEQNYQPAIRRCRAGARVEICHEIGNPHDGQALVVRAGGETIGYIAKSSFVRGAVFDEGSGVAATIKSIEDGGGGKLGVVLDLSLTDGEVGEVAYRGPARGGSRSTRNAQSKVAGRVAGGLLTRLLKGLFK